MKIGEQLFGAGLGMVTGGVGSLIQGAQQKKFLGLQAKYNEEMAQKNHERNKDMWNYTNYENQMMHMKNAGLSPGLIYGQSGGGGVSASGGSGQGVGLADAKSGEIITKSMGMGLQAAQLQSAIEVNKSQAEKNEAEAKLAETEAEKRAGVDTELGKETIDLLKEQNLTERQKRNVMYWEGELKESEKYLTQAMTNTEEFKTQKTQMEIHNLAQSTLKLAEETNILATENKITKETADTKIEQIKANLQNTIADTMTKLAAGTQYEAEAKAIAERVRQGDVALEQGDTKITQEWVNLGIKGADIVSGTLTALKKLGTFTKKINIK